MSKEESVVMAIAPLNVRGLKFKIEGTAPYMQHQFPKKALEMMRAKHEAGSTAKKGKGNREKRDFEKDFTEAMHVSSEGWVGIPAAAFRNATIDVCRMVGYKMTHARMSVFVKADGLDKLTGDGLVKIIGKPEMNIRAVRNQTGVADLRSRPMWRKWGAVVTVEYDADQFTAEDVTNLFARAGAQVGLGEGRPFSKASNGLGFGTFKLVGEN